MSSHQSLPQATPDAVPKPPSNDSNEDKAYTPRPLTDSTFTGLLNTSDARLEHNYRYAPLSSQGSTNASAHGSLYRSRLQAQLALNQAPESQHAGKQWNKRRQEAVARREDPNSAMLEEMERRKPDSYLERGWRKLTGKAPTVREEREKQERKAKEREGRKRGEDKGVVHVSEEVKGKTEDDGVVR